MVTRHRGETENHFIYRVYKLRDDTGTLTREECGAICNKTFCRSWDESAYRKKYEAFKSMFNDIKEEFIEDGNLIERLQEIENKEEELYKSRVKTQDQLREKRKLLRDEARIEALKDFATEIAKTIGRVEFKTVEKKISNGNSAILNISDWHVGKIVENYWNTFNSNVLVNRVQTIVDETLKYCKVMNVSDLYVLNLGDMIEGNLRVTSRVNAEFDILEQTMVAAETVVSLLKALNESGMNIYYGGCMDNHSRANVNFKEHIEKENFIKIINWHIHSQISNSDITFIENTIDENIGYVEVAGKQVFYVHGHLDKPSTVIQDLSMATGIVADYVMMAHYHKKDIKELGFAKLFINGSLSGIDEYAVNNRLFSKPSQTLLVFDGSTEIDININP